MKKFLFFILALITATLCLLWIADALYTYTYQTGTPRTKYQYIMQLDSHKIDYLFLGSSRVANSIISDDVAKRTSKTALNLGIEGAVLADNLLEFKLLLYKKIAIGKVYVQVDYLFNLEGVSTIGNSGVLPFIQNSVVSEELKRKKENYLALKYIPFYRYMEAEPALGFREFLLSVTGKKARIDPSTGFSPLVGTEKLHKITLPENIASKNESLDEFRSLCKQNNIELIIFCAPYCSQLESRGYLKKLKKKIPELYDFSRSLNDSLFHNCGHLNVQGAQVFTEMLIHNTEKVQ